MIKKTIMVQNHSGLHLRPAGQLCQKAMEYQSKITMVVGERSFNLKSLLSVLSAQVTAAGEIELICEGSDEEQALRDLEIFLGESLDEIS